MTDININKSDITLRPSSIEGAFTCGYQWAKRFLEGLNTMPGSRASIGTGIHGGAEALWLEAQKTGDQANYNLSAITDAAIETFREDIKDGVRYGDGEDQNTAEKEVIAGTASFAEDIAQYVAIPNVVEGYYEVKLDHQLVTAVGGTVDYLAGNTMADIKTSKRKPVPQSYTVQQSTYKYLVEANGTPIKANTIQGVVLKKSGVEGMVLPLQPKVEQAKFMINNILDRIDVMMLGTVNPHTLFPGNPKNYLCSPLYCDLYDDCPYVKGLEPAKPKTQIVL